MKTRLIAVSLFLVWLTSCIKDSSCPPTPPNKGWLISQVTEISFRSQSHTGPSTGSYQKTVHDIHYDAFNKPVIRLTAESPENDTSNLTPAYIDSLTYDEQQRMIEIRRYSIHEGAIYGRKFIYPGTDTLPSVMIVYDSAGTQLIYTDTIQYRYYATTVTEINTDEFGGIDSSVHIYTAGNLTHVAVNNGNPIEELADYDSTLNIDRYFNLSHGLIFGLSDRYRSQIRLSLNNWKRGVVNGADRLLVYDSSGLIIQTDTYYSSTGNRIVNRFTYMAKN